MSYSVFILVFLCASNDAATQALRQSAASAICQTGNLAENIRLHSDADRAVGMGSGTPGRHDHRVEPAAAGLQDQDLIGASEGHAAFRVVTSERTHQAFNNFPFEEATRIELTGNILPAQPGLAQHRAVLRV